MKLPHHLQDRSLTLGGHRIPYRVVESKRARYIRLRIGPEPRVDIILPAGHVLPPIRDLLAEHEPWILRQLERVRTASMPGSLGDGTMLPYLGKPYRLRLEEVNGHLATVRIAGDRLVVAVPANGTTSIRMAMEGWYRMEARTGLWSRAIHWSKQMDVQFGRVTIRDQRSRWGSCSSKGNLNFNWRLIMAPLPVLDYVVIHELMHLREMNHSRRFWAGVATFCPDYQDHIRWLKEHGSELMQVLGTP